MLNKRSVVAQELRPGLSLPRRYEFQTTGWPDEKEIIEIVMKLMPAEAALQHVVIDRAAHSPVSLFVDATALARGLPFNEVVSELVETDIGGTAVLFEELLIVSISDTPDFDS